MITCLYFSLYLYITGYSSIVVLPVSFPEDGTYLSERHRSPRYWLEPSSTGARSFHSWTGPARSTWIGRKCLDSNPFSSALLWSRLGGPTPPIMFYCLLLWGRVCHVYLVERQLELSGLVRGGEAIVVIDSHYQGLVKSIPALQYFVTYIYKHISISTSLDKIRRSNGRRFLLLNQVMS